MNTSLETIVRLLKKPEGQTEENFEKFTSLMLILPALTPEQLSALSFEIWHEARKRGDV